MCRVVFRFDANEKIGYGHMIRSMALAEELSKRGCEIIIFSRDRLVTKYPVVRIVVCSPRRDEQGYVYESIDNEISQMKALVSKYKPDAFIVDHYGASEDYFNEIRKDVKLIVGVDDCNEQFGKYPIDVLVNGNCYATKELYGENNSVKLLGSQYTLIRPEFLNDEKRTISQKVNIITISTGGADPLNVSELLIKYVKSMDICRNVKKQIVIGKAFTDDNLNRIKRGIGKDASFELLFEANMVAVMQNSDLFIVSSGSTLNELAITGTPSVSIILSEDQVLVGDYYHNQHVTRNLGWYSDISQEQFQAVLTDVIISHDERKIMSTRGQNLIDGKGALRVASAIIDMVKERNAHERQDY